MDGSFPIGNQDITRDETFDAIDPATGEAIDTGFSISTEEDVAAACKLAEEAFDIFSSLEPEKRAQFLESCADKIGALGETVIDRAHRETGLPVARLTGELGRTTGQLRLFARVLREGHWADVTIDEAMPDREPLPRPDLRRHNVAVGPVAVFGASNFPLAFSVAGGDTASALAAGCPVVVKGHPAHPGTSEMVAKAIRDAVKEQGLPEGVFSMVQGASNELGAALVRDPRIMAVGFTGSRGGGLALIEIAQSRPVPIPVYAEMSSINPVVLMPAALASRGEALASAYAGSLAMGAGQFCTNPGILLAIEGPELDSFIAASAKAIESASAQVMLTSGICSSFREGLSNARSQAGVETVMPPREDDEGNAVSPALLSVSGADFASNPALADEIFGPVSLVVKCKSVEQIGEILEAMEGQLTATLHIDPADYEATRPLIPIMQRKAGRVLANGWPTGVEVGHAMVHGGPFPATSDPRTTSVGAASIDRFLRPVCFQNIPDELLPATLKIGNPLGLPRYIS